MKFINLRKQLSEKVFNRILVIAITVSLTFGIGGQFFVSATADIIPAMRPGGVPDYFGTVPNYANSPLPEIDNAGKVIPGTGIPKFVDSLPGLGADNANEIPLIIQDKTFVPNDTQLAKEDPTWDIAKWGGLGNLWFPHVYMPNQNPYDNSGANPMGRWDYGPWFWPPYTGHEHGPVANPLAGVNGEPPMNPGVPDVSIVPEAYMDTSVVNGTAYPHLDVQPKPYRFRMLNAANDRFFNLQLYKAKSDGQMWSGSTLLDANAGEVNIVPAVKTKDFPKTWPTDGREGGVPDPATAGPNMVQIGTDGGFLTAPAELPNQPIDYVPVKRLC